MKKIISQNLFLFVVLLVIFALFAPFFLNKLLPIPSDTIIGLYHPFRDFFSENYPRGFPFKNFLITDPVRQIIPWKMLTIDMFSRGQLPLWNPYEMSGKPLLATFQAGVFYPFNIILFFSPFAYSWSIFIFIQQILATIFFYLFVSNLRIDKRAAAFGALSFVFSGFFITWLEWGTIIHTALWLPLILYAVDKVFQYREINSKLVLWFGILNGGLICSFFAGHLQTFFYVFIVFFMYLLVRIIQYKAYRIILYSVLLSIVFLLVTIIQWLPTLQYILHSARHLDQIYTQLDGWFLPWHHLIQFVAPDFFGNPVTMNYWGTWNYGELTGYIGLAPLILAVYSLFRKDRKTYFFAFLAITSLLFALPTPLGNLPFELNIPFIASAQPTRLLFVTVFSLAVLSAFGLDSLILAVEEKRRNGMYELFAVLLGFNLVLIFLWMIPMFSIEIVNGILPENFTVAKRNLVFPTALFSAILSISLSIHFLKLKKKAIIISTLLFLVTIMDVYRFGSKFLPFTPKEFLFPDTAVTKYLQEQKGLFRIGILHNEILAPNILTAYNLQSIEGYDPLYLTKYGKFISVLERGNASNAALMNFNRIITPHTFTSPLFNLLNAKYILSLQSLSDPALSRVTREGQTIVYENKNVHPRVFFVTSYNGIMDQEEQLKELYRIDLGSTAVVENTHSKKNLSVGKATITQYNENEVIIETSNSGEGFLVLMDTFYPTWKAYVDEKETKIEITNYTFRGILIPEGNHTVRFVNNLF